MMKTCTKCGEAKPFSEFGKKASQKDGLHYRCKPCNNAESLEWQLNNKDRAAARKREWYEKNRSRADAKVKSWADQNTDRRSAIKKRWRESNRDACMRHWISRRARMLQSTPDWLTDEHRKQFDAIYSLAQMLKKKSGRAFHVDHIIPLRGKMVCGLHVPWNLQVIPAIENLRKSNKLVAP